MKKLLLFLTVAAIFQISKAQDFTKVKNFILLPGQLENAKTEIDKLMADPKAQAKPEGWILKAKVYSGIYADEKLRAKYPGTEATANDAFLKYTQMDPSYKILKDDGMQTFAGDMYGTSFSQGVRTYNTKVWDSASYYFKYAVKYSDLIFKNKWGRDTTMNFDTTSILYAGVSLEKANNKDSAASYYGRLAQYKLSKIGGSDISDIYRWLVDYYYNQKKDEANTIKYLALGKEVYPNDLLWPDTELEMVRKKGNKDSLFAKYDEITKELPTNHLFVYNYGVELYNYAIDTSSGKRPANSEELITKAKEKLNKSLELNPDYAQAALLLGQITYNQAVDLKATTKEIKGQKPEDIKKRADIRVAAGKKFDEAIPYFEKVEKILGSQGKLKMEARTTLKDAYDLLITIYEQKNIKEKIDSYTIKFNNVDKDH
jgi:tetratricopeptide (TPR) repeat protein